MSRSIFKNQSRRNRMKFPIAIFATILASAITAQAFSITDRRVFETTNHKISESHVSSGVQSGEIQADYGQKTVKMTLHPAMTACPQGMLCAQVMPSPVVVELPIVSIKVDTCGILEVTALKDRRPLDGSLQQIKFYDATNVKCMFFVAYVQKATYETRFYSHVDGAEIRSVSTMDLLLKSTKPKKSARQFEFAEGQLTSGYPSLEKIGGGSLEMTDKKITLALFITLNCKPNQPCPKYMPAPVQAELEILSVEKSMCGDRIRALKTEQDEYGTTEQEILLVDYTFATCEILIPHPIQMTYVKTYTSHEGQKEIDQIDASFDSKK